MKEYFVFKEGNDIFMVDVASKEKDPNVVLMNDENKPSFYINVKFGTFVEPIHLSIGYRKDITVERDVIPLSTGGFTTKDVVIYEDHSVKDNSYSMTNILILDTEKNKNAFITFEDDDAARLWVETMKNEYPIGRD